VRRVEWGSALAQPITCETHSLFGRRTDNETVSRCSFQHLLGYKKANWLKPAGYNKRA